jgi:hypothetical protein
MKFNILAIILLASGFNTNMIVGGGNGDGTNTGSGTGNGSCHDDCVSSEFNQR